MPSPARTTTIATNKARCWPEDNSMLALRYLRRQNRDGVGGVGGLPVLVPFPFPLPFPLLGVPPFPACRADPHDPLPEPPLRVMGGLSKPVREGRAVAAPCADGGGAAGGEAGG